MAGLVHKLRESSVAMRADKHLDRLLKTVAMRRYTPAISRVCGMVCRGGLNVVNNAVVLCIHECNGLRAARNDEIKATAVEPQLLAHKIELRGPPDPIDREGM